MSNTAGAGHVGAILWKQLLPIAANRLGWRGRKGGGRRISALYCVRRGIKDLRGTLQFLERRIHETQCGFGIVQQLAGGTVHVFVLLFGRD